MKTSSIYSKLAAAGCSLAFMMGTVALAESSASAAETTFEIEAGTLSASLADDPLVFSTVPFDPQLQESTASSTVTVTDMRGTNTGWTTTIAASGLSKVGTGQLSIPGGNFFLTSAGPLDQPEFGVSVVDTTTPISIGGAGAVVANASGNSGTGTYAIPVVFKLVVPMGQAPGEYEGTMTVTAAPL